MRAQWLQQNVACLCCEALEHAVKSAKRSISSMAQMPRCCYAVRCTNQQKSEIRNMFLLWNAERLHAIWEKKKRDWIRAIRRDDWKTWGSEKISKASFAGKIYYRLVCHACNTHFRNLVRYYVDLKKRTSNLLVDTSLTYPHLCTLEVRDLTTQGNRIGFP